MVKINNLTDNQNVKVLEEKRFAQGIGKVEILEHQQDKSVTREKAFLEYYASQMNCRKRQALITLENSAFITSAGMMQWSAGNVKGGTDIKGVGDFLGKLAKAVVTSEGPIKPKYSGTGYLMLEPTEKYLIIENVGDWTGGMVLEDGLFMGCEASVEQTIVSRKTLSSIALGNEGLFNLTLKGSGLAILESPVPREELIEVCLENDEIRIDGNFAIAWSPQLQFAVEKSTKSLIGSAASGEGLVNVFRGTGKVLLSPVAHTFVPLVTQP